MIIEAKHSQRSGECQSALIEFLIQYVEELKNGDNYLSQLYLDEVIQTILLLDPNLDANQLRSRTKDLIKQRYPEIYDNLFAYINDDLEISLRKRFPTIDDELENDT